MSDGERQMSDAPIKIIETMPYRWNSATGDYDAELQYTYHWPDGTTSVTHACPRDEHLHLIEKPAEAANAVGKALAGMLKAVA
jgi:hypothetical protein